MKVVNVRTIPKYFKAIRWDGSKESRFELEKLLGCQKKLEVKNGSINIQLSHFNSWVNFGFWVLVDADGNITVRNDQDFHKEHETI
jgi:hypothetical protein